MSDYRLAVSAKSTDERRSGCVSVPCLGGCATPGAMLCLCVDLYECLNPVHSPREKNEGRVDASSRADEEFAQRGRRPERGRLSLCSTHIDSAAAEVRHTNCRDRGTPTRQAELGSSAASKTALLATPRLDASLSSCRSSTDRDTRNDGAGQRQARHYSPCGRSRPPRLLPRWTVRRLLSGTKRRAARALTPRFGTCDSYLYTSGYEGLMRIFDARPDAQTGEEPAIIDYHQEAVTSIAASVRSPRAATPKS